MRHTPAVLPISYAANVKTLLRGARHLIVVGPVASIQKNKLPNKVLGKRLNDMVSTLVAEAAPGRSGATATTLTKPTGGKSDGPSRVSVGVLPNKQSRYNSAARAESIRKVVAASSLGKSGKVAIVLVLDDAAHALAAANAVGRALPQYSAKGRATKVKVQVIAVTRDGREVELDPSVEATVSCARDSGELVDTPPTELDPETFALRAKAMFKEDKGVKVTEIKGDKLVENGLLGIHSVGRAAVSAPRLVLAQWDGGDAKRPHVALVGKGVTFDTGGLHIKGRGSMEGMKSDMGGAAAVLGAFRVLVKGGYPGRLSLLLCMAENSVDSRSYKPDDIIPMHSGKTVEINNTDAEGRLLLADGLSWAARELKADVLFDAATLTGAQLVSTGKVHAAIVSNDEELEAHVVASGQRSGDLCHPLPFAPELYQPEFRSAVADMRNSVANRMNAQSACAAQFLYAHIEDAPGASRRRWCHIDLAGPAFPKDRGTGFGVALVAEAVRSL